MELAEKIRELKNEYMRDNYAKNKIARRAYKKTYRESHKEEAKASNDAYWERKALETM
jgi:hypothetical protein